MEAIPEHARQPCHVAAIERGAADSLGGIGREPGRVWSVLPLVRKIDRGGQGSDGRLGRSGRAVAREPAFDHGFVRWSWLLLPISVGFVLHHEGVVGPFFSGLLIPNVAQLKASLRRSSLIHFI